ncbi:Non-functional pseudokinase ZED1 [Camellia lanceoleosa]|nr:Non-functional pseudokinase ZED1 [Camellia lanceoleosa]
MGARGSFGERPILVKQYYNHIPDFPTTAFTVRDIAVRDIVITSQMSSQKIVVKLIGCCLEFQYPFLVYEGLRSTEQLLARSLYKREGDMVNHDDGSSLSLKTRVRIANDIAFLILYIAIPLEESKVEDSVIGTSDFIEPEYCLTEFLTVKTNVYDFGMILVELLTGQRIGALHRQYESLHMQYESLQDYLHNGVLNEILDAKIRGKGGGVVQEQQLQALVELAVQCLQKEREDRSEMIDVAKEVKQIQRLVQTPISSTINPL